MSDADTTTCEVRAIRAAHLSVMAIVLGWLLVVPVTAQDVTSGEVASLPGTAGRVTFSRDSQWMASSAAGGKIRVWKVGQWDKWIGLRGHGVNIWQIKFSHDGKQLVSNENYRVKLWNLETRKATADIRTPVFTRCVTFTADDQQVISGHDDGIIRVWDPKSGRQLRTFRGHRDWVVDLDLSRDGTRLASASIDRTARVWDVKTGKTKQVFEGHAWYLSSVALGPHGKRVLTGSDDQTARLFQLADGKEIFTLQGHSDWIRKVAFSRNGKWLATAGSDAVVKVWDAATGKLLRTIDAHDKKKISGVEFSPDNRWLATAGHDTTVKVWDTAKLLR